jgi:hypothetical protein
MMNAHEAAQRNIKVREMRAKETYDMLYSGAPRYLPGKIAVRSSKDKISGLPAGGHANLKRSYTGRNVPCRSNATKTAWPDMPRQR